MNRRTILAALAALPFVRQSAVHAQEDKPFPLAPRPNPSSSCAQPFTRVREEPDWGKQLRDDLIVWAYDNRHLTSAYVALAPEMRAFAPKAEGIDWIEGEPVATFTVGHVEFRAMFAEAGMLPPNVLYAVMGDCGQLM